MREETRTGAHAFKGRGRLPARRGGAPPEGLAVRRERQAAGTSGRRPRCQGTRELAAPSAGPQLPSLLALAFPRRPASGAQSEGKGRGRD